MVDVSKLSKELQIMQAKLEPVEVKGEFKGRVVNKIVAGLEKLEHFFKTLKWESRQERVYNEISKQIKEIAKDMREFTKDTAVGKAYDSPFFGDFNKKLGDQLSIMKNICILLEKKPDKVDSEKVKTLEGEIQNLLVMARSRTVKPEPKWEKGVAKKQEVVGAKKPEESKAKPRFGTHRDEALREKHLEAAKATPLPEDAETLKDKLIDEQRILMEEYASKGEVPPKEIKTLIDTLKGMIREMSESEEVDLEKFQKDAETIRESIKFYKDHPIK